MMYAIYRLSDGVVIKHFTGPAKLLERNTPSGCAAIEGEVDALSQRVDPQTLEVVDYQPPQPSIDHEWRLNVLNGRPRWVKRDDVVTYERDQALARETIAAIETGQIRTIREALLGDATAIDRLIAQEPEIAAARAVLQRPRPLAQ